MGATRFPSSDPLTITRWSDDTFEFALQNMRLTMLMGATPADVIHVNKELTKQAGETLIFRSGFPLSGAGQGDDGDTTGKEEALGRRNMSLTIHERCHSVVAAGSISLKRTAAVYGPDGFRREARHDLGIWNSEIMENDLVTCLAGLYNENSSSAAIETINEIYPSSNRIWYGGQSVGATPALGNSGVEFGTDLLLTGGTQSENLFGTLVIGKVRALALSAIPRFRPARYRQVSAQAEKDIRFPVQGPVIADLFIILAHPYQIQSMKSEIGTVGWAQLTAACAARSNLHPIFTGGNALWQGCLIVEYDRIPMRTGAGGTSQAEGFLLNAGRTATEDRLVSGRSVCRAMLLGAQAGCFGWAMTPQWSEMMVDCNKPKIKIDMIYGVKTTRFNLPGTTTPMSEESRYCIDTEVIV